MRTLRFVVPAFLALALVVGVQAQPVTARSEAQAVLDFARAQLGKPYSYGATGLSSYDCSGLVFRAFRETGLIDRIGGKRRSARGFYQWFRDRGLVTNNPRPGDLVAWGNPVSHIGIYTGTGSGGNHRTISALVNPWGVSDHRVDGINVRFRAFLRVDLQRNGDGGGDEGTSSVAVASASSSNYTMNLRRGTHTLFRLNGSGSILERRTISRSSGLKVDVGRDIVNAGGRPHAQIQSGRWEGWWRRVPDAAPACCLHRFDSVRTLRLQPGRHLFKTFHANGRVVIRDRLEFDTRAHYNVEYRATFNGKRHFLIADGPMAGTWVVKSANSRLVSP